jgi:hypothetical protein
MTDASADQVAAIVAREDLHLPSDEHARLIGLFAELQPQLAPCASPRCATASQPSSIPPPAIKRSSRTKQYGFLRMYVTSLRNTLGAVACLVPCAVFSPSCSATSWPSS